MENNFKPLSFREALPRLVATYNQGRLVPFTGAGLSAPNVPGWADMVKNLCAAAQIIYPVEQDVNTEQLIKLSDKAVTILLRNSPELFIEAVRKSLGYLSKDPAITDQCKQLGRIWWPLVMTTNYDTMFVKGYQQAREAQGGNPISIFGRNQKDCHSLLSHVNAPSNTAYWALQGYFGNSQNKENLENEVVVGYRQYRRATFSNPTFRATFGEIFRNYSLLFIGSGLTEDYFMGLFGEVLEKFGSSPHMHCALFSEKDREAVDHQFLHTRLNIVSVFYDDPQMDFQGLNPALIELENCIKENTKKLSKLSFYNNNFLCLGSENSVAGLEISASTMPSPDSAECTVFSAGRKANGILLSSHGKQYIENNFKVYNESLFKRLDESLCWRYGKSNVYAAVARNDVSFSSHDSRDIREVTNAVNDSLSFLNGKYSSINMMLLAAGKGKTFPPVFSLIAMIRGYKKFTKSGKFVSVLKIHIVDPSVLFYMRRNPLTIEEMLNCDDLKLNIEIHDRDEIERFQIYLSDTIRMSEVSNYCSIKKEYWNVQITPAAFINQKIEIDANETIGALGLIPGSTITYTRRANRGEERKADSKSVD